MSKPHCITITISSTSDGETNQNVIVEEFASSPQELVYKNFRLADAVTAAVRAEMESLADEMMKAVEKAGGDYDKAKGPWE